MFQFLEKSGHLRKCLHQPINIVVVKATNPIPKLKFMNHFSTDSNVVGEKLSKLNYNEGDPFLK